MQPPWWKETQAEAKTLNKCDAKRRPALDTTRRLALLPRDPEGARHAGNVSCRALRRYPRSPRQIVVPGKLSRTQARNLAIEHIGSTWRRAGTANGTCARSPAEARRDR